LKLGRRLSAKARKVYAEWRTSGRRVIGVHDPAVSFHSLSLSLSLAYQSLSYEALSESRVPIKNRDDLVPFLHVSYDNLVLSKGKEKPSGVTGRRLTSHSAAGITALTCVGE